MLLLLLLLLLLCVCVELQTRECFIILKHNLKEAARLLEKRKIAREKKKHVEGSEQREKEGRARDLLFCALMEESKATLLFASLGPCE